MKTKPCGSATDHSHHEWRERFVLSRFCPGLVVGQCNNDQTHGPHYFGELCDELCLGIGLAGRCRHGEQMLNECLECEMEAIIRLSEESN